MKKLIWCFFILFNSVSVLSQGKYVEIDLANPELVQQTISVNNKGIKVKNLMTNKAYEIKIDAKDLGIIPPFSLSDFQSSGADVNVEKKCANLNDEFAKLKNDLFASTDEAGFTTKLSAIVKDAESKVSDAIKKDPTLKDCLDAFEKEIAALKSKTEKTFDFNFDVKKNMIITVTIMRKANNKEENSKSFVLKTPQSTPWRIHYGFTYQPNIISKYDQYYSKADTSNANKFAVTKKNGNQTKFWENISPTIMFSYPFTNKEGDSHVAFSAIAATNFSTFSAGAGLSFLIGENVAIGTGVMFTQKYVLNGQYKEGDIIKTNLSFDQLHEKKWGPEIYFTIALRFDKNPFSGTSSQVKNNTSTNSTSSN